MRLRDLHEALTKEQRVALAAAVGISPGYLWQIATAWESPARKRVKRPSLDLIVALAAADARLTVPDLAAEFAAAIA